MGHRRDRLLLLYAAWTFLSLLWSPNVGDAWLGAGQTLLYLLAFWMVVGLITLDASRRWVLMASAIGPAIIAVFTLLALSNDTTAMFGESRLEGSVGYYNGEAAFLLISFWVSIHLTGSRLVNPLLRGLVLAGAVLSAEIAVLAQSRGAMVALVVSLPIFFVFSGQRLRGLLALAPVATALFLTFPDLNNIYTEFLDGGAPKEAIADAIPRIWTTVIGVGIYGLLWGLFDRRWQLPASIVRVGGVLVVAGLVLVLAFGATVAYERVGSPIAWGEQKWRLSERMTRPDKNRAATLARPVRDDTPSGRWPGKTSLCIPYLA